MKFYVKIHAEMNYIIQNIQTEYVFLKMIKSSFYFILDSWDKSCTFFLRFYTLLKFLRIQVIFLQPVQSVRVHARAWHVYTILAFIWHKMALSKPKLLATLFLKNVNTRQTTEKKSTACQMAMFWSNLVEIWFWRNKNVRRCKGRQGKISLSEG